MVIRASGSDRDGYQVARDDSRATEGSAGYEAASRLLGGPQVLDRVLSQNEEEENPDDDESPPSICDRYAAGKMVIDPRHHPLLPYWDMLMMCVIIVVAFRVPFQLGFQLRDEFKKTYIWKENSGWTFDQMVDVIFMFDMFMQLFISCPDPVNHRWIRMPNVIVKSYLSRFFIFDLVSLLPYGKMSHYCRIHLGDGFKFLGALKILSLLKLMRVDRLIQRYHSRVGMPNAIVKLVKLLVMLAMSLHWIACSWGVVLSLEVSLDLYEGSTWGDYLRISKPAMFRSDDVEEDWELYTASLYWSCMTLTSIGYGDITASNPLECWAALTLMGACGIIWANIIGSICAIAGTMDAENVAHETQMDALNVMLKQFQLPGDDRMRLREFFQRRRMICNHENQVALLKCMSPDLQGIVARHVQCALLEKVWVFKRCAEADGLVVGLFERFEFAMYPPKELVVLPGCFVCMRSGMGLLMAQVLSHGSYWGVTDIVLQNSNLWEGAKVLSLSYIQLQFLTRESFATLINQKEYAKEARLIKKDAIWSAVQVAILRKLVTPLFEEDETYQAASRTATVKTNDLQSNGWQSEGQPSEVSRTWSTVQKQKCLAAKERAEHAEAKLSDAQAMLASLMRSGNFSAETCRKADSQLDVLLTTLSADSLLPCAVGKQRSIQDPDSPRSTRKEEKEVPRERLKL